MYLISNSHLLDTCFASIPWENIETEIQWENWCVCLQLCISYYKMATEWKCFFLYVKYLKKHTIITLLNLLKPKQPRLKDSFWRRSCSFRDFMPLFPSCLAENSCCTWWQVLFISVSHFSIDFIGSVPSPWGFFIPYIGIHLVSGTGNSALLYSRPSYWDFPFVHFG